MAGQSELELVAAERRARETRLRLRLTATVQRELEEGRRAEGLVRLTGFGLVPAHHHRGNPVPMYRAQMHSVAVNFVASTRGVRQDSRTPEFLPHSYHNERINNKTQHTTPHHETANSTQHLEHSLSLSRTRLQTLSGVHGNHDLREEPGPSMSWGREGVPRQSCIQL
jgi:hypothetical protein